MEKNMNKYKTYILGSAKIQNIKLTEYFYSATAELGLNITAELRFMNDLNLIEKAIQNGTEIHFSGYISGDISIHNWIVVESWSLLSDYETLFINK